MKAENSPKLLAYLTTLAAHLGVLRERGGGLFLSKGSMISSPVQILPKRFRKWLTIFVFKWQRNLISSDS